ncbi:MAG: hypothetical protein ABSG14_04390 [Verrucomicrobiia bacterium]|jgi:hypothetical protein
MKRVHGVIKIARVLALIGVFTLLANSQSKAQLLTLQPVQVDGNAAPDFTSQPLTVTYTPSTTIFQVSGYYSDFGDSYVDPNGNLNPDINPEWNTFPANFNLTAYITNAGVLTNGTLTIDGDLTGNGDVDTTLLTGTLTTGAEGTAFGASSGVDAPFQFLFTITGGSLSNDYGGVGAPDGYVNYLFPDGGNDFSGSFANSFANSGNGYADVDMIPEPSSFLLLVLASALCAVASKFHRSRRRDM